MRRPRNRSLARIQRTHTKAVYTESASKIQRFFQTYIEHRYEGLCNNHDDDEIFMLNPVRMIPKSLLVVVNGWAFHALHLFTWLQKSNKHPMTRVTVDPAVKKECVEKIEFFMKQELKDSSFGRKSGHCRRRAPYLKALKKARRCRTSQVKGR